jgi:phosphoesterase RecJ-like protein
MAADPSKSVDELNKILEVMLRKDRIAIISHVDPDGDSTGSQIALGNFLQSLGKKVLLINQDEIPSRYGFLDPQKKVRRSFGGFKPDLVLVLECSNLNRIGKLKKMIPPGSMIINIDHHPDNTLFGSINYLDTQASATGEIIYDLLKRADYAFDLNTASALYTAILTDTGRFSFSNTRPRTLTTCARLIQLGADPKFITDQLYFNHSAGCLRLLGNILDNLELLDKGRYCSLVITHQLLKDFAVNPRDTEGFVDYALFLNGVVAGALFLETSHRVVRVSLRSPGAIDVSAVAKLFGGGGHRNASGFVLNQDLDDVKKMVNQEILRVLEYDCGKKQRGSELVKK